MEIGGLRVVVAPGLNSSVEARDNIIWSISRDNLFLLASLRSPLPFLGPSPL